MAIYRFVTSGWSQLACLSRYPGQWKPDQDTSIIGTPEGITSCSHSSQLLYDHNPRFVPVGQNRNGYGRRIKLPWIMLVQTLAGLVAYRVFCHATPEGNRYFVVWKLNGKERKVYLDKSIQLI